MRGIRLTLGVLVAVCVCAVPGAGAADRVYWGNLSESAISFANLDASGGANLDTTGATVSGPRGVTIDPAAGRIYWANSNSTISFARLSGGGGGSVNTTGATVSGPEGVAIDPAGGRIYWASSFSSDAISFANLDGSGGGDLDTTGATVNNPIGVMVDPGAGRIYWANANPGNKISFANLNNTGGGGDLNTAGATVNNPQGVALDPAAGRIYWANTYGQKISFANLDGSAGGDLDTTGATVDNPAGVAIDPSAGRIYWGNCLGNKISFANLNNTGGGDLSTTGATTNCPIFPALLEAPAAAGPPAVSVAQTTLSCSLGTWAPDLLSSLLYRAPESFAFQWSRDGADVAGATGSSFTAGPAGVYRCRVTARNEAGAASQTSDPYAHFEIGKAKRNKRRGTARLPVTVPVAGALTLTGRGVVTQAPPPQASSRRPAAGKAAARTVNLLVKARGKRKRKLNRKGAVKVKVTISFAPSVGPPSSQSTALKLKRTPKRTER